MSPIKVVSGKSDFALLVTRLSPWGSLGENNLNYLHYIFRAAELHTLKFTSVFHHLLIVGHKQLCAMCALTRLGRTHFLGLPIILKILILF